jgi:hypothetical protein
MKRAPRHTIKVKSAANPTRVFISYAWEGPGHKAWVEEFARRLERSGFEVVLDQWHLALGDQIATFIEEAIKTCEFVLLVCTPTYKKRSDRRIGGVGYENDIMAAERLIHRSNRFIPILRTGNWNDATPTWLLGTFGVELSGDPYDEGNYRYLRRSLAERVGSKHKKP